jgi:4-alpha-glucanotransferase
MPQLDRSSGILLHPTSLPAPHGVGTLGAPARRFVDRLADSGQSWWQILPLTPPGYGGSPYSSGSAFAGNPHLIDLTALADQGLVDRAALDDLAALAPDDPTHYAIGPVNEARREILGDAYRRWESKGRPGASDFADFRDEQSYWLDDYALFVALEWDHEATSWRDWPADLVARDPQALEAARERLQETIDRIAFEQWKFDRQWRDLRAYADDRGVELIGDAPIFVAMESADVWAHRELFKIDESGRADVVAGVPPDYFSETGQKWGNPLYDWEALADTDYEWWMQRLDRLTDTVTLSRIDHFRGFQACWEVPADAPTAETGEWVAGPRDDFFEAVDDRFGGLPFIAEDLGTITEEVHELRDRHELPGMKVMQFAFEGDPDHPFLPHTYPENCVAYTGTHDNNTTLGWYRDADESTKHQVRTYLSHPDEGIVWALIEAIMESDAALSVFPAQDILGLGAEHRMNTPGTAADNWSWRMTDEQLADDGWETLRELTEETDR